MPRFAIWSSLAVVLPTFVHAQQPERYTLSDDYVAIYDLVGNIRLEPGTGAVNVLVTRAGGDAGSLRVAQGELDGRSTLRVLYPGDRIRWRAEGRDNSSTQLRVREDGTFGDPDEDHWGGRHGRHGRGDWDEGRESRSRATAASTPGRISSCRYREDTGSRSTSRSAPSPWPTWRGGSPWMRTTRP